MKPLSVSQHVSAVMGALQRDINQENITSLLKPFQQARTDQRRVWVLGNGGSESNASHLVLHLRDLNFQAHNLMDGLATLSALSNDFSYQAAPMKTLRSLGRTGDMLVVLSGSGDSINVLAALAEAKHIGMHTMGLLGFGGGAAQGLCDSKWVLPHRDYGPIEDAHSIMIHILTSLLTTDG